MTKRATGAFERKALDFYPTPPEAIEPLLPHLWRTNVHTFVEPCVGGHSLADYLEASGFDCVASGDLATGKDARDWKAADFADADASITSQTSPDLSTWTHLGAARLATGSQDSVFVGGSKAGYYRILRLR